MLIVVVVSYIYRQFCMYMKDIFLTYIGVLYYLRPLIPIETNCSVNVFMN